MEKATKQRLLGGVVLVAGAALFLPMLLDGSGAVLTVPPMPAPPTVPGVEAMAPALDDKVKDADQAVTAAHEGQTFADAPASTAAPAEEDVAADAAAASASDGKPATPATADSQRAAAAAKAAQDKAAQEQAAKAKAGQAEQEKARLAAAAANAKKPEPAKPAAPASTGTALPEAWVVQVASLSARDKADALVQKLRQKNYHAVSHQQGAVWKVVVGPELSREVAEAIKSRLAADPDLKLSGWVQSYKP